ncbi:MAG: type II toxin-antitoxin system RelE/ParE family toxin [Clostridiales bacterium]|jgi:plasmid stabilization system protein ParE|nr:type II toxin-antitoxin system RelE/ParE family toxin [Clostridiales bacterium]
MPNDDKVYAVKITDAAWTQMIEHARFLANVSAGAAERLIDEFVQKTGELSRMPERCPWLVHGMMPFQKYRKSLFGKYHMALFEIHDDTVYVAAVVDCRQDFGWLL